MNWAYLKNLKQLIRSPILIKKKENLFYLTGRFFMHGYLLIKPINADKKRMNTDAIFFGDGLEKVENLKTDRLKNIPLYLGKAHKLELEDEFTFAEYNYIKSKIKDSGLKIKVEHVRSPVDYQRAIKESGEIALVKKSMQIVEAVFRQVRKKLMNADKKRIITERGLAEFIQNTGLKMGANDLSFPAIVASGANAAIPHHVPSNKKLKAGESIILDFGFKYKNYCSDFTRTVFLKKVPPKLELAYNQVEKAYLGSMEYIEGSLLGQPQKAAFKGVKAGDVYQKAVDVLAEKRLDKYFIHSLGHGTGLEIHELPNLSPNSKDILRNGMVFSIEPGVYIPKLGGVRIEDLVELQQEGVKRFINISTKLKDNII